MQNKWPTGRTVYDDILILKHVFKHSGGEHIMLKKQVQTFLYCAALRKHIYILQNKYQFHLDISVLIISNLLISIWLTYYIKLAHYYNGLSAHANASKSFKIAFKFNLSNLFWEAYIYFVKYI